MARQVGDTPAALTNRSIRKPDRVSHADWSTDGRKRWIATAVLEDGRYRIGCPTRDPAPDRFLDAPTSGEHALFGFDFPIGVPQAYAGLAGISHFAKTLPIFGSDAWDEFFTIADSSEQIRVLRPFYPPSGGKKGQFRRKHLEDALGIPFDRLLRICERRTRDRRAASALFWLLGGQQVGRGAIHGWEKVLQPALKSSADIALWPFDGDFADLIDQRAITVAETYPAEFYGHLGFPKPPWSKRRQTDRQACGKILIKLAKNLRIAWDEQAKKQVEDGFGGSRSGEDPFDAVVGLVGMINIVCGGCPPGPPKALLGCVGDVEGWILGQTA
jgi:hypothetical protein